MCASVILEENRGKLYIEFSTYTQCEWTQRIVNVHKQYTYTQIIQWHWLDTETLIGYKLVIDGARKHLEELKRTQTSRSRKSKKKDIKMPQPNINSNNNNNCQSIRYCCKYCYITFHRISPYYLYNIYNSLSFYTVSVTTFSPPPYSLFHFLKPRTVLLDSYNERKAGSQIILYRLNHHVEVPTLQYYKSRSR